MHKTQYTRGNRLLLQMLVTARREAGISQEELGRRLKESQSWISKVERGARRLDVVELGMWCLAIGLPLSEFILRYEESLLSFVDNSVSKTRRL